MLNPLNQFYYIRYSDIKLEFIDNGDGIDENDHSKVFDRFVRLEKHRQTNGNGLGLSMVKAIVKLHDANISLSNKNTYIIFIRFLQMGSELNT